jgi:uncharacterized membrane protein
MYKLSRTLVSSVIMTWKTYAIAIGLLIVVDCLWLFTVGQSALTMTAAIQGEPVSFRILPAIVVYIALAYLVIQSKDVHHAALVGAATYAVYDFTSLALLKKYSPIIAIADTLWGGVLFAVVKAIMLRI